MTIHDEAKLTAYALGELDEAERREMDARLSSDPAAREAVEEIRRVAAVVSGGLAGEPLPELTDAQRANIEAKASAAASAGARKPARSFRLWVPLSAAAGLLIGFGAAFAVFAGGLLGGTSRGPQAEPKLAAAAPGDEQDFPQYMDYPHRRIDESLTTPVADPARAAKQNEKDFKQTKAGQVAEAPKAAVAGRVGGMLSHGDVSKDQRPTGDKAGATPQPPTPVTVLGTLDGGALTVNSAGTLTVSGDGRLNVNSSHAAVGVPVTVAQPDFLRIMANAPQGPAVALAPTDGPAKTDGYYYRGRNEGLKEEAQQVSAERLLHESTVDEIRAAREGWNREAYDHIVENPFRKVADHPLSTFSIDVDTASYANVRRLLNAGTRPPRGAVRIEELVNYFPYDYQAPRGDSEHPFAAHADAARCPWNADHRLVRLALKGREIDADERPAGNFVFLLDVSGSMKPANKLPLVKQAMQMLVDRLGEKDRVAIAVYAGASGLVLNSTACDRKRDVLDALSRLEAGGSTNGGAGIQLAYNVAGENLIKDGVNRVILCTDGDFNVGVTSEAELTRLIEEKAKTGVFLSVLGFGMGNYQDSRLEKLADKGNGNYAYIDTIAEARKVLVDQMTGTLVTIAKDVKIQVEFNPARVEAYRLLGYENRMLAKEDFRDDTKDAGEIGAGHTVTALYEIVPAGKKADVGDVDPLRYQSPAGLTAAAAGNELLTLKLRYKKPDGDKSIPMEYPVTDKADGIESAPADFRFAAAVASFGMILRDSQHKGTYTLEAVIEQAASARGADPFGYRAEFVELAKTARKVIEGR